jgi:hypothetical protein
METNGNSSMLAAIGAALALLLLDSPRNADRERRAAAEIHERRTRVAAAVEPEALS